MDPQAIVIGGVDDAGTKIDLAYVGYWQQVTLQGSLANVSLPDNFTPTWHHDGMFGLGFVRVNPQCLGIEVEPDVLAAAWESLATEGMVLDEVMASLVVSDITTSLIGIPAKTPDMVHRWLPSVPAIGRVVELVGHVAYIRSLPMDRSEGFEQRLTELRRELRGIFRRTSLLSPSNTGFDWNYYMQRTGKAAEAVGAKESEFNVLKQLLKSGHTIRLPKTGSDFAVIDRDGVKAEVKSRHDDFLHRALAHGLEAGFIKDKVNLTPEVLIALVSWAAFATIRRATEEQKATIVFCDLSHTFIGPLLPAVESFWGLNLDFRQALSRTWNLAAQGKQPIVVFVSLPGLSHFLKALVLTKEDVQETGKPLWDMNRVLQLAAPDQATLLAKEFKGQAS